MGCFSAPSPPDYTGAAQAAGQSSADVTRQQTYANRPTINTPFGGMTWQPGQGIDPSTGKPVTTWTGDLSLPDNELQALRGQEALQAGRTGLATGLMGSAGEAINRPFDFGATGDARIAGENAIYGKATSRLDPQWNNRENALKSSLINQGLDPSSEIYNKEMDTFNRGRNDAYSQAGYNSILGGQEFANRELGLEYGQRSLPLNLINAAITGQQVGMPQMPGFAQAGRANPTDYLGAAGMEGNYNLANQNMQNELYGSGFQGLGSAMGMLGLVASDERLKTDVERHDAEAMPGVPFASFRYKSDPMKKKYLGVIAQDVEKVRPDKVHPGPGGYRMVDPDLAPFSFGKKKGY